MLKQLIARQNCSLNSSSIGDSFVRVDALVKFFARKEVRQKLLDFRNSSRASNQNNVVDLRLVHLSVTN
uniref:Uncharacterized protein n=1 Tax=Meloidogyne incognita TaxID=6306 RepID=A0A914KJ92_MELIC